MQLSEGPKGEFMIRWCFMGMGLNLGLIVVESIW